MVVIFFAGLILFGPKKLPELAQMVGKGMRKVKQAQAQLSVQLNSIQEEMKVDLDKDIFNSELKNENQIDKIVNENIEKLNNTNTSNSYTKHIARDQYFDADELNTESNQNITNSENKDSNNENNNS